MPDLDGWQTLERIRDLSQVPVMMLTARGDELERVRGLQAGADDYVVKPFGRQELVARVQALDLDHAVGDEPAAHVGIGERDHVTDTHVTCRNHTVECQAADGDRRPHRARVDGNRLVAPDRQRSVGDGKGDGRPGKEADRHLARRLDETPHRSSLRLHRRPGERGAGGQALEDVVAGVGPGRREADVEVEGVRVAAGSERPREAELKPPSEPS